MPVSSLPASSNGLPIYHHNSSSHTASQPSNIDVSQANQRPIGLLPARTQPILSPGPGQNQSVGPLSGHQRLRDIYWCVDKVWTEPSQTLLRTLSQTQDDELLCQQLKSTYEEVHGLRGRLFSWKTCTSIDFVSVSPSIDPLNFFGSVPLNTASHGVFIPQ